MSIKNSRKQEKGSKGITLIALVITIIVLLILAGISIATLTGENGILSKAETAKKQTEIEEAKEQAKLDISTYVADKIEEGKSTKLNDGIIQEILIRKDYVSKEEGQPGEHSFKTYNGQYEILYSELYTPRKVKVTFIHPELDEVSGDYELDEGTTWGEFADLLRDINGYALRVEDYSIKVR